MKYVSSPLKSCDIHSGFFGCWQAVKLKTYLEEKYMWNLAVVSTFSSENIRELPLMYSDINSWQKHRQESLGEHWVFSSICMAASLQVHTAGHKNSQFHSICAQQIWYRLLHMLLHVRIYMSAAAASGRPDQQVPCVVQALLDCIADAGTEEVLFQCQQGCWKDDKTVGQQKQRSCLISVYIARNGILYNVLMVVSHN